MNVWLSQPVIQTLPAPTHLDPSRVDATQDTGEMEQRAMVGSLWAVQHCDKYSSQIAMPSY